MDQYPSFVAPVDPAKVDPDTGESADPPTGKRAEPVVYGNLFSAPEGKSDAR